MKINPGIFKHLLLVALCVFLSHGLAPATPMKIARNLRQAETGQQISEHLKMLGFPDKTIEEYRNAAVNDAGPGPLFTKDNFLRMDTFEVNIDDDPEPEVVSQIIFAYDPGKICHDRFDVIGNFVYFILVHDDSKSDYANFDIFPPDRAKSRSGTGHRVIHFEETVIGDNKPVIFYFQKTDQGHSNIIFKIKHLESCGVSNLSSLFRQDRLEFAGKGRLSYQIGEWKETASAGMDFSPYKHVSKKAVEKSKSQILRGKLKFVLYNDDYDYEIMVFETPDHESISMNGRPDASLGVKKGDWVFVEWKLTTLYEAGEGDAPYYFWKMLSIKKR